MGCAKASEAKRKANAERTEDAEFAEKRDGNTEITEIGTQRSQREAKGKNGEQRGVPRSLRCAARRAIMRRERKVGSRFAGSG